MRDPGRLTGGRPKGRGIFTAAGSSMPYPLGRAQENGMQYTEQQKTQFKQDYSRRRRNQLMVSVPLVGVMLALVFAEERHASTILGLPMQVAGPIFLAVVAGAVFFSFRNWRFPACSTCWGSQPSATRVRSGFGAAGS